MKSRLAFGFLSLLTAFSTLLLTVPTPAVAAFTTSKYIVVLNDNQLAPEHVGGELAGRYNFSVDQTYSRVLKGFAATMPAVVASQLKADPRVKFVTPDRTVQASTTTQTTPTGIKRVNALANAANKGTGVGVAIIDTGIDLTHPDLKANIVGGKSCITNWWDWWTMPSANDDNGHGSHVAGTIAALDNAQGVVGVAPEAKLIPVKVLNSQGSGTWSQIICGIDWVTSNAAKYNIKVANLSLGGSGSSDNNCGNTNSDALHLAICRSVAAGITYVVAAGNNGVDAKTSVPAAYDDTVITVSALADSNGAAGGGGAATSFGSDDTFASFSNFGPAVDLAAPGTSIYSTWKAGGYNTISGTSMAAPHVSGAAALYLKTHPGSSWSQVRDGLKAAAEPLGKGHTDPSGKHPEPVLQVDSL